MADSSNDASDRATTLALEAANEAFQDHVKSLYSALHAELRDRDNDATDRAANGVILARKTLAALRKAIGEP
jgi:hypothetical protein